MSTPILNLKHYEFNETPFNELMPNRIYKVLIICSNYDFYMLEEDGRIDEQIFNEYVSLNLRYPPIFVHAANEKDAFRMLKEDHIDLIISMLNVGETDAFELSKTIKKSHPTTPIVVLTHFSREVSMKIANEDLSAIDHVFCWLGNADILLAIVKLMEDKMNFAHDVGKIGVQAILLVENSIRFYSSYLPILYKVLFTQARQFMVEGLNEHRRMMRMRGRPKIILATTYEEALRIYDENKENLLGIISDIRYKRDGKHDAEAGLHLSAHIKQQNPYFPILLQSSDSSLEEKSKDLKVSFMHKHSQTLLLELRDFVTKYFGFGDFVFINPDTDEEIARATNLKELQYTIFEIPDKSLNYHIKRHHFAKWLRARAIFPIAQLFSDLTSDDFDDNLQEIRKFISQSIARYRMEKSRGVIAKFDRKRYDQYLTFSRIGHGYLGGKGRGLAFIDSFLKKLYLEEDTEKVKVRIPRTVVLSTSVFDEFMELNKLYRIALSSDNTDREILDYFVAANFPEEYKEDLRIFLKVCTNPIAVRSSSVLEDSHYQPFAGIYSTYMVPFVQTDLEKSLQMLLTAIKSVYASVYYQSSKDYMTVTHNVIDQERMAIILQEVSGSQHGTRFYPTLSGVARSLNFYPIEPEEPEHGIAQIALGLGKTIVDGGVALRFSPKYPQKVIQLSSPNLALRDTQKFFYALDLNPDSFKVSVDEGINLLKLRIKDAEQDGSLKHCASTYDLHNHMIRDGIHHEGKKIITFANILKYNTFPLPEILSKLLEIGQQEMNNPVEIEFAVTLDVPEGEPHIFHFLQIRPIVDTNDTITFSLEDIDKDDTLITCHSALGNGIINDVYDFIYIKPDTFNAANTPRMVESLEKINSLFLKQEKNYILVGPGRWGSSDSWLGIPVKWSQISAARVIVESGLHNYRIDPSQGTHFFQNLTSFRVAYFTINPYISDGFYDIGFLDKQTATYEDEFIRHVHFEHPMLIKVDGKHRKGVIMKPAAME